MRLVHLLLIGMLLAPTALSMGKKEGEEFMQIDLTALPQGGLYFLRCSEPDASGVTDCGFLSLWEQTNGVRGLQTSKINHGRAWPADELLLG